MEIEKNLQENEEVLEEVETAEEDKMNQLREDFLLKYREAQDACKITMDRIARDLRETDGNPYIRATSTFRYDICRSSDDAEPVDSFIFEKKNGCTLRSLAVVTTLITAANVAIKVYAKKKIHF